jgi:CRP-like cAMP-binding protein
VLAGDHPAEPDTLARLCVRTFPIAGSVLNIIGPGEVFGEVALLDGGARTANATAMSYCDLITTE